MKEELELKQKELLELIAQERRLNCMEEYHTMRKELLDNVARVLDLRDAFKTIISNNKKTRKIINKYAKTYKKEKDIKKIIENMEEQEETIGYNYKYSVFSLMKIVFKILYAETFRKDLPVTKLWYDFDMEDMVLVNGLIRELKRFNSSNVTADDILGALNFSIYKYGRYLEKDIEYTDMFEKSFPFVRIKKCENNE